MALIDHREIGFEVDESKTALVHFFLEFLQEACGQMPALRDLAQELSRDAELAGVAATERSPVKCDQIVRNFIARNSCHPNETPVDTTLNGRIEN
jgi:hypothetical protein